MKKATWIITADEEICDKLIERFREHKLVTSAYGDTGQYYTNGEAGPTWYTCHLESDYDKREELESDVFEYLN